MNVTINMFN